MRKEIALAQPVTLVALVVTGLLYRAEMTALVQLRVPVQSNGRLPTNENGRVVGSEPIAQAFTRPGDLQPRPSTAGDGDDPLSSGRSNLGSPSPKLRDRATKDLERLRAENPDAAGLVPAELVTTSARGFDPHLSPQAALWQVPPVAKARGIDPARVRAMIEDRIEGRTFGFLGEPQGHVLRVNVALDRQFGRAPE